MLRQMNNIDKPLFLCTIPRTNMNKALKAPSLPLKIYSEKISAFSSYFNIDQRGCLGILKFILSITLMRT